MGGYYSVACLEVVGVHFIISVTTALSVAWLVGSSAFRYHQLCPPQPCMPALGLQLKDPARPRLLGGAEVLLSTHPPPPTPAFTAICKKGVKKKKKKVRGKQGRFNPGAELYQPALHTISHSSLLVSEWAGALSCAVRCIHPPIQTMSMKPYIP